MATYETSFSLQLIYVYRINDKVHEDCLKIGQTTAKGVELSAAPNSKQLNELARGRINHQTQTAGISYELLHTELTAYLKSKGTIGSFNDKNIHDILLNSGIKQKKFDIEGKATEWFITDLGTVQRAISAAKEGRTCLSAGEVTKHQSPIAFRPEQEKAIKMTTKRFHQKDGKRMLWNAKMRFGKTLSALEVVKRMEYRRTLILTHRPVVDEGWHEDFAKIFFDRHDYAYCQKGAHENFKSLEAQAQEGKMHYIYFASMQDLRGSEAVGGKFEKNDDVFSVNWDMLIIDEAHEGTQTDLGEEVVKQLEKPQTRILQLSGTPFNLLENVKEEEVFTWDYVMEQREKAQWEENHPGEHNPYASLPTLSIYTYDLGALMHKYEDDEKAFNFREFFRTLDNEPTRFVHEQDVKDFLDLMCNDAPDTLYPFSNQKFRDNFRHTLWMVPGVKAAAALSILLRQHPIFGAFNIANVAGEGDEEEVEDDALLKVRTAITSTPENAYSITLSCGRLTTGVSVKEWTAVFMLSGQVNTSPATYMQTIFRVQTPATIAGRMKTDCFVFDFAPDRTLRTIAEVAKVSTKAGKTTDAQRKQMGEFINYCSIIAMEGSVMKPMKVDNMLQQLKRAYVERVVSNGFEDGYLYTDELWKLDKNALNEFEGLKAIIGTTKAIGGMGDVIINEQGFDNEVHEGEEEDTPSDKKEKHKLTEEEKQKAKEKREREMNRKTAISILRGISIRMPLLIYGAELDNEEDDLTLERFVELIDAQSWKEFMPTDVTKQVFNKFKKYYDRDVFAAAAKRIRAMARAADKFTVEERIERITAIFNTFRNPDKETVLTPWRVVNMHMADTLGGWCFYADGFPDTPLSEPRYVMRGTVTAEVFRPEAHILEINSKSGLYPLYVAYNIYRRRLQELKQSSLFSGEVTMAQQRDLWNKTIAENVFVICMTPMAKAITRRTLLGFQEEPKANLRHFDDLLNQLTHKKGKFVQQVRNGKTYWKTNNLTKMEFDAVVGNPPYQVTTAKKDTKNGQKAVTNIFQYFQQASDYLAHYTSLIYPGGRWMHQAGKGMKQFGHDQINDVHLDRIIYYADSNDVFKSVAVSDGISVVFKNFKKNTSGFTYVYKKDGTTTEVLRENPGEHIMSLSPFDEPISKEIDAVVESEDNNFAFLSSSIYPRSLFSIESDFVERNPEKVRPYSKDAPFDEAKEIKLLTNDKAGKSGRARWYIANRDVITTGLNVLDDWKVIVSSANAGGQKRDNQIEVVDPNSAFGRARIALRTFKTREEAYNFLKWCKTDLVRYTFLLTDESLSSLGKQVPDLCDYTNENGFIEFPPPDINKQVYELFHISPDQQAYIKGVLKELDSKRHKKAKAKAKA